MVDEERFLRLPEVVKMVGLSKTEIYKQAREGSFPKSRPYPDNPQSKFWLLSDIHAWMHKVID